MLLMSRAHGGRPARSRRGPPPGVDPAILLLVGEIRRGNDALRREVVSAQKDTTTAFGVLGKEMVELRKQAPGRLSFYLAASVVVLALVAVFGVLATRGVNVNDVAHAVHEVAPSVVP